VIYTYTVRIAVQMHSCLCNIKQSV